MPAKDNGKKELEVHIAKWIKTTTKQTSTYLRESLWVLYSMTVFGGRLRTLLRVSRMRVVVAVSCAVLFHTEMMSSCQGVGIIVDAECAYICFQILEVTQFSL